MNNSKIIEVMQKSVKEISTDELEQAMEYMQEVKEEIMEREREESFDKWSDQIRIDSIVAYKKKRKKGKGVVVVIKREGIQLEMKDRKRNAFVRWYEIKSIEDQRKISIAANTNLEQTA